MCCAWPSLPPLQFPEFGLPCLAIPAKVHKCRRWQWYPVSPQPPWGSPKQLCSWCGRTRRQHQEAVVVVHFNHHFPESKFQQFVEFILRILFIRNDWLGVLDHLVHVLLQLLLSQHCLPCLNLLQYIDCIGWSGKCDFDKYLIILDTNSKY